MSRTLSTATPTPQPNLDPVITPEIPEPKTFWFKKKKIIIVLVIILLVILGLIWLFWPKGRTYYSDAKVTYSYRCFGFKRLEKENGLVVFGAPAICYGILYDKKYYNSLNELFNY
jgi:hypothetical protein